MRKLLTITVPAFVIALLVTLAAVEAWVRTTWNPKKGRPGFFEADPVRVERLAPNYDGWYAGVPVHINSLGFRDPRDYALAKNARTFRIIVLGDSVTFGHGSVYDHTYPYLLEQRLKAWRSGVDWQVWNLGVPGYNTAQELANLLEVGPRYDPDLVIVGFYINDIEGNEVVRTPSRSDVALSHLKTAVRRRFYSIEFYRRVALALGSHLAPRAAADRARLDEIAIQEDLIAVPDRVAALEQQQLTRPRRLAEGAVFRCTDPLRDADPVRGFDASPGFVSWQRAVTGFQRLAREGRYRIVFFINAAVRTCKIGDVFDPRETAALDRHLLRLLSTGSPAVSSHDAFLHYRPSEMPLAGGHSLGNSNAVKADVLFEFLTSHRLLERTPAS